MGIFSKTTLTENVDNNANKYSKTSINEEIIVGEELTEEEIINHYKKIEKLIFEKNDKSDNKTI